MTLKAVGFDLFGTLLQARGDNTTCLKNLHEKLCEREINIPIDSFLEAYREVHANYRAVRTSANKEVSNQVELSEVLRRFGYEVDADSPLILDAVSAYFSPWTVTPVEGVEATLQGLSRRFKTGVITNFTDSTFVYKKLRDLNLLYMLDCVVISAEVGWRKPSPRIFDEFLRLTMVGADETLFVGDDVNADVAGAKAIGMTTVFLTGENYNREAGYVVQPDFIIHSIRKLDGVVNEVEGRWNKGG